MTITYTAPTVIPSTTTKKLVTFAADVINHRIVCNYDLGYLDGNGLFVKQSSTQRTFTDDTTPSFANFVANCPAAAQLRRQTELYEVTLDKPGSVD